MIKKRITRAEIDEQVEKTFKVIKDILKREYGKLLKVFKDKKALEKKISGEIEALDKKIPDLVNSVNVLSVKEMIQ